ncbi:MAG: BchE/P-methylase family protein, partial [uncultured Thermomicrobiales bacterium]
EDRADRDERGARVQAGTERARDDAAGVRRARQDRRRDAQSLAADPGRDDPGPVRGELPRDRRPPPNGRAAGVRPGRHRLLHRPGQGRLRGRPPLPGARRQDGHRGTARDGDAAGGAGPRRRRGRRRGRAGLAGRPGRFRGGQARRDLRGEGAGVRPGRGADAPVRPARPGEVQPDHGPDRPRLPLEVRVLRLLDPAHTAVQDEAGGEDDRRDPGGQGDLAAPVRRVRRRQQLRRQEARQGAAAGGGGREHPLVHRDGHRGRRGRGAARPDAGVGLRPGADRPGEPDRGRAGGDRDPAQLETRQVRGLPGGDCPDPGPRDRRQRLLRAGDGRRHGLRLRRHPPVRRGERTVRGPDHGGDGLPGDAALPPAAGRGAAARPDGLGEMHRLRRQRAAAADVGRGAGGGVRRAGPAALLGRGGADPEGRVPAAVAVGGDAERNTGGRPWQRDGRLRWDGARRHPSGRSSCWRRSM